MNFWQRPIPETVRKLPKANKLFEPSWPSSNILHESPYPHVAALKRPGPFIKFRRDFGRDHGMLTRLTRKLRLRTAAALALVYALCVVAPPLALAFADGAVAAHCLTTNHHGANAHVHGDGSDHSHDAVPEKSGGNTHKTNVGSCCGLFCFAAVTGDIGDIAAEPFIGRSILPVLQPELSGQGPDRIKRPPKSLLSL